ncbi:MAG: glycosyltransferase [Gemmataceae bacterium]|nr:glycosyltransferase [Gemmataceae bacterium]
MIPPAPTSAARGRVVAGWAEARLAARAVGHKLWLLYAYQTTWRAALRGGRLLARGRVREFARRLVNERAEVRGMDAAPTRDGPPLVLAGHIAGPGGYDHLVLAVLRGLTTAGVAVRRDVRACVRRELVPPDIRPVEGRRAGRPRLAVTPPHLLARFRPDRRTAAFTMWETDALPPAAVRSLNRCGLVVVPSQWGADCFRANGVTVPIEVVPLGYDPEVFGRTPPPNPLPRGGRGDKAGAVGSFSPSLVRGGCRGEGSSVRSPLPPRGRGSGGGVSSSDSPSPAGGGDGTREGSTACTFGTAGALDAGGLRKNVPRVIDLFRRAFPDEEAVRLRVKITPSSPPVETHGDPRVEVVRAALSPGELADWYRSLTAFVNASFGEGFGLHLLEAMACGVPLVSTAFGGAGAFFDAGVGYAVPHRLVEARNAVYSGRWADPDDRAVVAAMRRVYADPTGAARLGAAAADRAARFTWSATTAGLVAALARHGFLPAGDAAPPMG